MARGGFGDRTLTAVIVAALVICGLYVGREIFVPIVLAVLLSFVLAPLVDILERWHFPRPASVPVVVLLAFIAIFALGGLIVREVKNLAESLPRYQQTMQQKIQSLRALTTTGPLDRAADLLQNLGKQISGPQPAPSAAGSLSSKAVDHVEPIPVEVRSPPQSALENISALISPLLHPLATVGIVIVFVIFILFQREDLRNRFIKLAGSNDLQSATAAIDDAASRLSRLFLTQVLLNAGFGVIVAAGLLLIGVPSAILWGILAAIMRFVPYVGPFIAAFFPLTLAIAVDPGWSMLLWSGSLILLTELLVGQAVEPLLVGHSSGLSPVAVVMKTIDRAVRARSPSAVPPNSAPTPMPTSRTSSAACAGSRSARASNSTPSRSWATTLPTSSSCVPAASPWHRPMPTPGSANACTGVPTCAAAKALRANCATCCSRPRAMPRDCSHEGADLRLLP